MTEFIKKTYGVVKKALMPSTHYETPDPTPIAIPIGFARPERLEDQIARLVSRPDFLQRVGLSKEEYETFEESDDFGDDDEDDLPRTPYEQDHLLASIQSVDRGHTKAPIDDGAKERTKSFFAKHKKAKVAPKTDDSSVDPQISED